ncbi:MAG: tRNA 2-thiouridine(34) synthase MnmA [Nanoarchaeota archaeon]
MKHSNNKSVLLGLSGGVDSSIAAYLLKKQGYEITAVFLKLYSDTKNKLTGECHWLEDYKMAQKIAIKLGIPLIKLDYESLYKSKVINPMFHEYKSGLTPNPDLACNSILKFPILRKEAEKRGIQFIATGHYAKIKKSSKGFQLLAGRDSTKDQSYFLAQLSQQDLKNTLFPLGNLTKTQVRTLAKSLNFPNYNKHGTAGICFVGQIPMHQFLQQRIKSKKGIVKSPEGIPLGTHQGIQFYTIGQKALPSQGIIIDKPNPQERYYIAKKIKPNTLIIAPENHPLLKRKIIKIHNLHKINTKTKLPRNLKARIRHLGQFHSGTLKGNTFTFSKPLEALAQGQYLVLYKGNQVLACGEIRF